MLFLFVYRFWCQRTMCRRLQPTDLYHTTWSWGTGQRNPLLSVGVYPIHIVSICLSGIGINNSFGMIYRTPNRLNTATQRRRRRTTIYSRYRFRTITSASQVEGDSKAVTPPPLHSRQCVSLTCNYILLDQLVGSQPSIC